MPGVYSRDAAEKRGQTPISLVVRFMIVRSDFKRNWMAGPVFQRHLGITFFEERIVHMNRRVALYLTLPAMMLLAAGLAIAKPNFTGDWKLDADKSNFGPMPPPTSMSLDIDHTDPNLKIVTKQSGAQGDLEYEA